MFEINLHFVADTDTDGNYLRIRNFVADADTAVLCSVEGQHSKEKNDDGHNFHFIAGTNTEKNDIRPSFRYEFGQAVAV